MSKINLTNVGQAMTVRQSSLSAEKEQFGYILDTYAEDKNGKPVAPNERIRSAHVGRGIYEKLSCDDRPRERNRAKVQAMVDYKPPYDQKALNERGRGSQFNVNFGEGAAIINDAVNNYVDVFTSTETLLDLPLVTDIENLDYDDRDVYQSIMDEEFTTMVRSWDQAMFSFLELVNKFVTHGVAISLFPDKMSWMFSASSLTDFKFPQRTKAVASAIEVCASLEMMSPTQLSEMIRNEEKATELGWDVDEVKRVIVASANLNGAEDPYDYDNYEHHEEKVKANEFSESSVYTPIKVIRLLVKEHSGKVSSYLCSENAYSSENEKPEAFMFRSHECYESMNEAMHIFPFYTGTSGNIHTIRGLGHMVYPQVQASNLMQCAMLDSARDAMSTKYITPSEKDISNIPIVQAGPHTLIPSHMQIATVQHSPDLSRSAVPAMNLLSNQISRMSTSSSLANVFNNGQDRRSTFEVGAAIEFYSSINASAMRLFNKPWRELLVEMARRAFRPVQDMKTQAGQMAKKMQERCIERGVPKDLLTKIDFQEAKVRMPVGLGNKSARNAIFAKGAELLTEMDEVGRERFARDRAVELFGPEQAAQYIPNRGQKRQLQDTKIAELENNQLMQGLQVSVDPSENFLAHLRVHIPPMFEMVKQYEEGQAELVDVVQRIMPVWEHANETLSVAVVPSIDVPEINQARQALQQLGEIIGNGIKAIQKQQREAAEAQAQQQAQGGEGQGGVSEEQAEIIRAQSQEQMKQQQHALDLQRQYEKHQQNLEINRQKHEQKMTEMMQERIVKNAEAELERAPIVRSNPITRP